MSGLELIAPLRALLATGEPAACHAALSHAVQLLDDGADSVLAAELARTPYGPAILWRTPQGPSDEEVLRWFARAQTGRITECGDGAGLVMGDDEAFVALVSDLPPPREKEVAMRDLASAAAQHLSRLRRDGEMRRRRERLDGRDAEQAALLRA